MGKEKDQKAKDAKKEQDEQIGYFVPRSYKKIPDGLWLSPEFNALPAHTRCVFLILLGTANYLKPDKPFILTYDRIRELTGFGRNTISRAITELMQGGFIEIPQRGGFPKNVSMYQIDMKILCKEYPAKPRPLPEYLEQFLKKDIDEI